MTPAGEMREALHAGRAAAESRQPHDSNPHAAGETARDRVLAVMWRKGYQAANPIPE